ncbi:MAG: late competence development ComFB family protein [Spirochaetales bacterium]
MALEQRYNLEDLTNDSERLVFDELERQLDQAGDDICRSVDCVLDMAAYALNRVRPKYRANLLGRLYAHAEDEERIAEVREAVREAILRVSENPPD